ncbi:MAG: helix-hairpin-helix domain-containing protein [Clostridium sp.]
MKLDDILKNKKTLGIISITIILVFCAGIYVSGGIDRKSEESIFTDGSIEKVDLKEKTSEKKDTTKVEKIEKVEEGALEEVTEIVVDIKGEVKNPGVYTLESGSIIEDLIKEAGGITKDGTLQNINRAQVLQPNEAIIIANKNELDKEVAVVNDTSLDTKSNVNTKESSKKGDLINLNIASATELTTINGIGTAKAEAIISYREEKGGFKSIEEVQNVSGIGKATFEKMRDKICV